MPIDTGRLVTLCHASSSHVSPPAMWTADRRLLPTIRLKASTLLRQRLSELFHEALRLDENERRRYAGLCCDLRAAGDPSHNPLDQLRNVSKSTIPANVDDDDGRTL